MLTAVDRATLKSLGATIKARRLEMKLTQPQLAVAVGCSIGFLRRLEAGEAGGLGHIVHVVRQLELEMSLHPRST